MNGEGLFSLRADVSYFLPPAGLLKVKAQQLILRRPCVSILSCGQIYIDIQRLSEFAFFSTNKSDKKDKLSHQSLNITSSSNAIVKIFCHTITLFVTPVRRNRGSR